MTALIAYLAAAIAASLTLAAVIAIRDRRGH